MICAKHSPPKAHTGCLAKKKKKNHVASWKKGAEPGPGGQDPVVFWLPVDGYPDFYIHFGVGYMKDYSLPSDTE